MSFQKKHTGELRIMFCIDEDEIFAGFDVYRFTIDRLKNSIRNVDITFEDEKCVYNQKTDHSCEIIFRNIIISTPARIRTKEFIVELIKRELQNSDEVYEESVLVNFK